MSPKNPAVRTKTKKRPRPPPNVNARNLAIEKRRREDMNEKFLDLARCVPALASTKRLSKTRIVNESLVRLRQQRAMCLAAAQGLRQLLAAYDELASEVSTMRSQLGIPARNFADFPTAAMVSLLQVENETFGEFADGFGSQQASPSSVSHPVAIDTLSGFSAEEVAPIAGHGSADPNAPMDVQPIFNDIDFDGLLSGWPDQSLESFVSSYDYPALSSSATQWMGPAFHT